VLIGGPREGETITVGQAAVEITLPHPVPPASWTTVSEPRPANYRALHYRRDHRLQTVQGGLPVFRFTGER
jgi:hypothetical protein